MKFIFRGLMFEITVIVLSDLISSEWHRITFKPIQLTCGYSCTSWYIACSYILKWLMIIDYAIDMILVTALFFCKCFVSINQKAPIPLFMEVILIRLLTALLI